MDPYLYLVTKSRYRQAIARFRCSSHTLEIEIGRHTSPKTPVTERKCRHCDVIEDEKHLLLMCDMNMAEREYFFRKISRVYDGFTRLNNRGINSLSFSLNFLPWHETHCEIITTYTPVKK